jgi:hypothetical protein
MGCDSTVGIATGYRLDGLGVGVRIRVGATLSRRVLGPTEPAIQWVTGTLLPEVKRPGREDNHLPPNSGELKNTWIYTSTPPYVFVA